MKPLAIAASIFFIDQVLKHLAAAPVINPHWAFSLPASSSINIAISTFLLLGLLWLLLRPGTPFSLYIPLALLLGAGASNTFDRLAYGGVIDYLHLGSGIYNLADAVILLSLTLIISHLIWPKKVDLHS